ncbi:MULTISPECIES: hypothetical protein [Enterococcus]|uniref:hypothetical protein n=1 Tax=Enterococcus TaxID=1350 RepID=UPI0009BF2518|nr:MULTISPECIES: hypothetical protein [Enterococcus]MBO0489454.1 hypothetical protein [Enterococcus sp. DIV1094]
MPYYIANKNKDDKGRHELHESTCNYLPLKQNQLSAGNHSDCSQAILALKKMYTNADFDGCKHCCSSCHKG